jgi:hypothetical protein
MKNLLLISYVFPPGGGAGVQRAAKFAKYLPQWGWNPIVVTAKPKSMPVKDTTLLEDLPAGLPVYRLTTLEPSMGGHSQVNAADPGLAASLKQLAGNMLFPDRNVLWLPTALPGAISAARKHDIDLVFVTAPPFSTLYLGAMLAKLLHKPLALDFRDDWAHAYGIRKSGLFMRRLAKAGECRLVRSSDLVIGNTPAITRQLKDDHGGAARFATIRNGYDPHDFEGITPIKPPELPPGRLHLLYTGTVYEGSPLHYFWQAMRRLPRKVRKLLWVEVIGRVAPGHVADPGLPDLDVLVRPYEPHQKVLARMLGADALLLTLGAEASEASIVPGKTYEYLAARRPIFAVVPPEGEAGRLVNSLGAGRVTPPDEPEQISGAMVNWLNQPMKTSHRPPIEFNRCYQSGKLAGLMLESLAVRSVR